MLAWTSESVFPPRCPTSRARCSWTGPWGRRRRDSAASAPWADAGRPGRPRKLALAYFALGPEARESASATIRFYYAWLGDIAEQIVAGAAVSPEMIKGYLAGFAEAGCDELIFAPGAATLDQITLLAEAIA